MSAPAPELAADLTAGLRRLKLAAVRELAPPLLVTTNTQRWTPEEVLRTLVEAEITSCDASNTRARLKAAAFPVVKTLEQFDLTATVEGPPYRAPDVRSLTVHDSQSQTRSMPRFLAAGARRGRTAPNFGWNGLMTCTSR